MIKVSVLYSNEEGKSFDMEYYVNRHMPMVQEKLGAACRGVAAEQGLSGGEPGSPAPYIAMGHMYFDTVEAFLDSFGPHAQSIGADLQNYTEIQPVIQVSEVKIK